MQQEDSFQYYIGKNLYQIRLQFKLQLFSYLRNIRLAPTNTPDNRRGTQKEEEESAIRRAGLCVVSVWKSNYTQV